MNRRTFLQTATGPLAMQAQGRRRNIVYILADDHRYDFVGALGHPWLKGHTPNLDRLINSGVHFRNAFVTSSLCSPSRASILTSLYMHQHRISDNFSPLDPKLPVFPKLLRESGYRTAFIGKWHMGGVSDAPQAGFDHWLSFRGQGEYENPEINRNGTRLRAQGNMTDILTGEARQFIRDNASQPFCVYLSHKAVHAPFRAPDRHTRLFEGLAMPRPKTMPYKDEYYRQWPDWVRLRRPTRHGVDGAIDSDEAVEVHYRRYCQSLIAIDESVGQIMKELESRGLLEDTLVVYMGDNGFLWGEHGLIDKRAMYEASIRVPLFAHCPALFGKQGRKVDAMALNLDIAPTFLDAAGLKPAVGMMGQSLLGPATGRVPANWRKDFLYQYAWEQDFPYTPNIVGLRSETHSLMHYPGAWDIPELYDIRKDPDQINNLIAEARIGPRMRVRYVDHIKNPETKKIVVGMQERLAAILTETGGDPRLSGQFNEADRSAL
ncbi:MAG: sulfatase [Candidatus Solibacter usitatus]|nr:sulfatase [Candidatus Solibacter usitatus]